MIWTASSSVEAFSITSRTSWAIGFPSPRPSPPPPPRPLRPPAHLADADVLVVHRGDRADEAGVADVDPGVAPAVGLVDDHHRVLLQPDSLHVVQDAAVVHPAVLRGLAENGEARAVEQLGEEVGQP